MRFDLPIRKHLNQMIYPFYLLHQPIILLVAFYLQRAVCNDGVKVFILIVFSFVITCGIYFLFIKPFNVMRVAFGLKIN
jgi:peptidoglycan/LPS O-acetylase OafA/YrhL